MSYHIVGAEYSGLQAPQKVTGVTWRSECWAGTVHLESPSHDRKNAFAPKSTSLAKKIFFVRPIPHRINSGPR